MNKTIRQLASMGLLGFFCLINTVHANTIVGPTSGVAGNIGGTADGYSGSSWGIVFTANRDTVLFGFDFSHKNLSENGGTIHLTTASGTNIDSWNVAVGASGHLTFDTHDVLQSGVVYHLTYTQTAGAYSDELFAYLNSSAPYPPTYLIGSTYSYSNADITVTNGIEISLKNGLETGGLTSSTGFSEWYAFNSLTTPEPSSFGLLGLGGLCLLIRRLKKGAQT